MHLFSPPPPLPPFLFILSISFTLAGPALAPCLPVRRQHLWVGGDRVIGRQAALLIHHAGPAGHSSRACTPPHHMEPTRAHTHAHKWWAERDREKDKDRWRERQREGKGDRKKEYRQRVKEGAQGEGEREKGEKHALSHSTERDMCLLPVLGGKINYSDI